MKRLMLLMLLFTGCDFFKSHTKQFEELQPPIILVGKWEGSVTLCDKSNRYLTIPAEYYLARNIAYTYEKGDTIIFNK